MFYVYIFIIFESHHKTLAQKCQNSQLFVLSTKLKYKTFPSFCQPIFHRLEERKMTKAEACG